jgi:AcrR family transcriptional regulator
MIFMAVNRTHTTPTAQRRQRQIEDCLYQNLLHAPWQSISVADICRQVGISRKAYYNYYKDKESCFCSYIDRVIRDTVLETSQSLPDNATPLMATTALLEHWKGKKELLDILVKNQLLYYLTSRTIHYVLTEDHTVMELMDTEDTPTDSDILSCYTSIQFTLIFQWYHRGFDTPAEEMAKKFLRLLYEPLIKVVG